MMFHLLYFWYVISGQRRRRHRRRRRLAQWIAMCRELQDLEDRHDEATDFHVRLRLRTQAVKLRGQIRNYEAFLRGF